MRGKKNRASKLPVQWIAPVFVALVTFITFFPTLQNQFVEWDDYENLISNAHYRGLGWAQLGWMLTTFHMGPYQPLSWMTYGLDYVLWGMNPAGYHLTSLLFHGANAVFFYFISRRLLAITSPTSIEEADWRLTAGAAFAALMFSIHPLRVESVAWATERRDVVSGFFFLATIYCYLRANLCDHDQRASKSWLSAALGAYVLSLLGKATAMTLPLILLILDIYPLRRLAGSPRNWWKLRRGILREKILFAVPAAVFAVIALLGQQQASALKSLGSFSIESRIAQALFGASFYLWKTIVPVRLSPLYEIPSEFSPLDPAILAGGAATVIVTVSLYFLRKRWPAGLACGTYSVVMLAPVLGIVSTGPQLVAERYSYLSCLSWALLAGGLLLSVIRSAGQTRTVLATTTVAAIIVTFFSLLTWRQTMVWRDTGTLWTRVLRFDPNSSIAHYNLARFLANQGRQTEAIAHYREALSIRPDDIDAHNNLGLLLVLRGDTQDSINEFLTAAQIAPQDARSFFNLGRVYAREGELDKALENYQQAVKLDPNRAEIRFGLGNVFARQGLLKAAAAQFELATKLKSDFAEARVAWARALAAQGKKLEAEQQYQEALRVLKARGSVVSPPSEGIP
jgi:Tfp pilus assembly protein PilF